MQYSASPSTVRSLSQRPESLASLPLAATVPLFLHKIPAGFPSPAADYIDVGLDLNEYLIKHKAASFYFSVQGDSMTGAGILDGDKVLVDRSITPAHGNIVVAVVDGEFTLKRLFRRNGILALRAEHPNYPPIRMTDGQELIIWGVVTGLIRKFKA